MTTTCTRLARNHAFELIEHAFPDNYRDMIYNIDAVVTIFGLINTYTHASISPEEHDLINDVYENISLYTTRMPQLQWLQSKMFMLSLVNLKNDVSEKELSIRLTKYTEILFFGVIKDVMETNEYSVAITNSYK